MVKSGEVNGCHLLVDLAVTLPGGFHLHELDSRQCAGSNFVTLNFGHPENRNLALVLGFVLIPVRFGWLIPDEADVVGSSAGPDEKINTIQNLSGTLQQLRKVLPES